MVSAKKKQKRKSVQGAPVVTEHACFVKTRLRVLNSNFKQPSSKVEEKMHEKSKTARRKKEIDLNFCLLRLVRGVVGLVIWCYLVVREKTKRLCVSRSKKLVRLENPSTKLLICFLSKVNLSNRRRITKRFHFDFIL